jgi:hypothetical protein
MKTPPFDLGRILSAVLFIVVLSWVLACVDPNSKSLDSPESAGPPAAPPAPPAPPPPPPPPTPQFGNLTLRITDSPITDAERIVVQFSGVEIKPLNATNPEVFDFSTPRQIDLLALEGGDTEILVDDEVMPAGEYEWIRLKVNAGRDARDSYIDLRDGSRHALFMPDGSETGLTLRRAFIIGAASAHDFIIDFDLRKSVVRTGGLLRREYELRPALRLVDNLEVGRLDGHVDNSLVGGRCVPAAYLFTGANVVPDDVGSRTEPLASTSVHFDSDPGVWHFILAFIPAGTYTLAFTCEANRDNADTDDRMVFSRSRNVTIAAGLTTTVTLLP